LVSGPEGVAVVDTEHHVNNSGRYDVMDVKGHVCNIFLSSPSQAPILSSREQVCSLDTPLGSSSLFKTYIDSYANFLEITPTEEELATLPKVAGSMPVSAYYLCAVEFAERASYYGCKQVFKNFVRGKLPVGGNGAG
jgi:hypothetical protein